MLKLSNFPMPLTSNQMYASVRGRLIKSAKAREYGSDCDFWALARKRSLNEIKFNLEAIRANGGYFKVDAIFVFHKSKVFSKKGVLKRLDPSNRLKMLHDNLARILGFDDSLFVTGSFEKAYCDNIKDEQAIITITEYQIRAISDI